MLRRLSPFLWLTTGAVIALVCCRGDHPAQASSSSGAGAPVPVAPLTSAERAALGRTTDEQNTVAVFRKAAASSVFVAQKRVVTDFFRGAQEVPAGSGSGFIWDAQGHVVTNFHVVQGARTLTVTLADQRSYPAKVVGTEPRKDIAVLKIDAPASALVPIERPPNGALLEVGQKVLAIGNPFGLDHTLTTGIVSALGREVDGIGGVTIRDMVQTDAAINPGNSGGPLLDSGGRLIGMNTMIFSKSGASAGIGFAVPVSTIARVVPQIIRTGHAEQAGLGIRIDPMRRLERRSGLDGVAVLGVAPGSPAERAGLQGVTETEEGLRLGDVIVAVGKEAVHDYDDLYNALDKFKAGDEVDVSVRRGRAVTKLRIALIAVQ